MSLFLRPLIGCLCIVLLMQSAYSQEGYVPGYLIKAPSDTLRGLLLNEDWKQSPDAIYFKSSAYGGRQKVSAGEVIAFHLDATNEHFVAKPVTYHLYRREVDAGEAPLLRTVSDTVFLQQILQGGGLTLYSLLDVRADQRFFLQNQEVFTELIYYTYQRLKNQKRYVEKIMGYKGQLAFYLTGCNTLSFKALSYTEASITNLLLDYMACVSGDIIKETPLRKVVFNGTISGGVLVVPSMGVAQMAHIGFRLSLPYSLHQAFALVEAGPIVNVPDETRNKGILCAVSGGSYWGKGKFKPYMHGGIGFNVGSGIGGGVLLAGGISYKKKIHLEVRNGLFYLVRLNF